MVPGETCVAPSANSTNPPVSVNEVRMAEPSTRCLCAMCTLSNPGSRRARTYSRNPAFVR